MKEGLLLLSFVIAIAFTADPRCLEKSFNVKVNLRHETDCRKYYTCTDEHNALGHVCPEGLEYNAWLGKCDKPIGFCGPDRSVLKNRAQGCANGHKIANPHDETTYFSCENSVWTLLKCTAPGATFDVSEGECSPDSDEDLCTENDKTSNPLNNSSYYSCESCTWILMNCGTGLVYESKSKSCIKPSNPNSANCVENQFYPNKNNKNKFFICYNGQLNSQECPNNMQFNSHKNFCELARTSCGNIPHGGFAPAQLPSSYYVCRNGEMILQLCPPGQRFNPIIGYCTRFIPVHPPRPPILPPPPPPSLNCGPLKQGQFIADALNETQYFVCMFGKLIRQNCLTGMVFSNSTLYCVKKPTTPAEGMCGPYSPRTRIPVCNQPGYYLQCVMGVFFFRECPKGQIYNNDTQECSANGGGGNGGNSGQSCGIYANGEKWYNPSYPNQYYQCDNGNNVTYTCPQGQCFCQGSGRCQNPCATDYADAVTYFVADPNSKNYYYQCLSGQVVTPTSTRSVTSFAPQSGRIPVLPTTITSQIRIPCPSNQWFYKAFQIIPPNGDHCMNPSNINKICLTGSSNMLYPQNNPECNQYQLTPYYVNCTNGLVQRCSMGSIIYNGVCIETQTPCNPQPSPTSDLSCICD